MFFSSSRWDVDVVVLVVFTGGINVSSVGSMMGECFVVVGSPMGDDTASRGWWGLKLNAPLR